jgi:alkanesulfonate monooxygenase SsuD/methylene tetrahydromethanopterin reductase-like flavin-dependent oxidoreductase (luciferase family)
MTSDKDGEHLMRLGMDIPLVDGAGATLDAAGVMQRARLVEEAGFDGIWNGDASYFRGGYTEVDPLQWMLLAMSATTRIEVGLAVYQVPLRHPVDLAQRLMTLHALSGGRFTCGVGPGSMAAGAFEAVGVDFDDRFRLLHAHMATIRGVLSGAEVDGVLIPPLPGAADGSMPFVLGVWRSPRLLAIAARDYDGWMTSCAKTSLHDMRESIARYRDAGGTRAMTTTCRVDLDGTRRPMTDDDPFQLICGADEAQERLARLAELGFDDVGLRFVTEERPMIGMSDYDAEQLARIRALFPRVTTA